MNIKGLYRLSQADNYRINLANINGNAYGDTRLPPEAFSDAIISRPSSSLGLDNIAEKALFTINGYVHKSVHIDDKLYLQNAARTLFKTGKNAVGILSWLDMDKPLDKRYSEDFKISAVDDYELYEKLRIDFEKPVDGCLLIFMGYILTEEEGFFFRVSDRSFILEIVKLDLYNKLYELNKHRDIYADLGVPENVGAHQLKSDIKRPATIQKMFELDNTFLVNFPGYRIDYTVEMLEHSGIPTQHRTEIYPDTPLFGGYGKLIEYKFIKGNTRKNLVITTDALYHNLSTRFSAEGALKYVTSKSVVGHTGTWDIARPVFISMELSKL